MANLTDTVDFVMKYSTYTSRRDVENNVLLHTLYHTMIVLEDEEGIYAMSQWNMVDDETAHILDLIIREDKRKRGLMYEIIDEGVKLFPAGKYIMFEKGYDDGLQNKELKKYKISDFLRRRKK